MSGKINEIEIADELARLLVRATELRSRQGERVGTLLSGGLDSRGILAAMPLREEPLNCVTFGKAECLDLCIACKVAEEKQAAHHFVEIDAENFLKGRAAGVWWIDGESNVMDLHVAAILPKDREFFDIVFDGFWGDTIVGGRHIRPTRGDEIDKLENRGRRYIVNGPRFLSTWLECRLPYCDNDLVELAMSLPQKIRANSDLHKKMLLRNFASFYDCIPWEHTWVPIGHPRVPAQGMFFGQKWIAKWFLMAIWRKLQAACRSRSYVDYDSWLRQEPARSWIGSILESKTALYPEFVSRQDVVQLWHRHLNGFDEARQVFVYLTLEVWLQQLFEGKFRPRGDTPAEAWAM